MSSDLTIRSADAFALEINFVPGVGDPTRIFKTATALLKEIESFDREFAKSIDSNITSTLVLQSVEEGSLRIWVISLLQSVDDDALKSGDWKRILGSFLFQGKYKLLRYLQTGQKDLSEDGEGLTRLRNELLEDAKKLEITQFSPTAVPSKHFLVLMIVQIAEALKTLQQGEGVVLENSKGARVQFPTSITISPQDVERLTIENDRYFDSDVMLLVKKPDLLGESKWSFVHEGRAIEAKMLDGVWLESFRHNEVPLPPGASLRAKLRQDLGFSSEGEKLTVHYSVVKVFGVVPPSVVAQQISIPN